MTTNTDHPVDAIDRDVADAARAQRAPAGQVRAGAGFAALLAESATEGCTHCSAVAPAPCVNPMTGEPTRIPHAGRFGAARRRSRAALAAGSPDTDEGSDAAQRAGQVTA